MRNLFFLAAVSMCAAAPLLAAPTPTPKPKATAQSQLPVARPVPGKPGLVYSPYARGKIMSVSIYKHGEIALCPYTGRKFRAP